MKKSANGKMVKGTIRPTTKALGEQFKRQFILRASIFHHGNVSSTARALNVGRRNLQVKIRQSRN